jgi:NADPH2:quinone reductase
MHDDADRQASVRHLFRMIRSGAVKIRIGQTFPLKDAAKAHRALESRATTYSTVLIP